MPTRPASGVGRRAGGRAARRAGRPASIRRRRSSRPATRIAAWRRSSRPTPATSSVATAPWPRWSRSSQRRAAAGRRRSVGHRQVVGRSRPACCPALAGGALAGSESLAGHRDGARARRRSTQLAAALGRVADVDAPRRRRRADAVGPVAGRRRRAASSRRAPGWSSSSTSSRSCSPRRSMTASGGRSCSMIVELAGRPRPPSHRGHAARRLLRPAARPTPASATPSRGRTVALGAMTAAELADAVRLPAAAVGVGVEPALVERIAPTRQLQPGALPLVQHTMAELFAGRKTQRDHARRTSTSRRPRRRDRPPRRGDLRDPRRATAHDGHRQVFLRLVSVSEDHDDTRRRVRRTELEQAGIAADELDAVLRRVRPPSPADVRPRPDQPDTDRRGGPRGAAHRMAAAAGLDRRGPRGSADPQATRVGDARLARRRVRCQLPLRRRPARARRVVGGDVRLRARARTNAGSSPPAEGRPTAIELPAPHAAGSSAASSWPHSWRRRRWPVSPSSSGRNANLRASVAEARRVAADALVEWPYDRALLLAVEGVRLWDSPERGATCSRRSNGAAGPSR